MTGSIPIFDWSHCQEDPTPKKKNCFCLKSSKRTYQMYADTPEAMREWIAAINQVIQSKQQRSKQTRAEPTTPSVTPTPVSPQPASAPAPSMNGGGGYSGVTAGSTTTAGGYGATGTTTTPGYRATAGGGGGYGGSISSPMNGGGGGGGATTPGYGAGVAPSPIYGGGAGGAGGAGATISRSMNPDRSPRKLLVAARKAVPFLADEESKVLEFWQIWHESIPTQEEVQTNAPGLTMDFTVSVSANMQKLTWRAGIFTFFLSIIFLNILWLRS